MQLRASIHHQYNISFLFADTSSREDQADLWDELMLMKNMKPHENILNILGHSTMGKSGHNGF